MGADPLGPHHCQGHATLGALPGLRLAHPGVPGAAEIFDGSNNKFPRAFLKFGQAALTAKDVLLPVIRGSELAISGHGFAANRVQEENRRQVFLRVVLEFSQALGTAKGVMLPLIGGLKLASRGYFHATDGIFEG
jgi:hypothetical protein